MKVGIIGTGEVGRALGSGFTALSRDVMIGARDAKNPKARDWAHKAGPRAQAGTFADAAKFGEVLVLATLWSGTENAIRLATPAAFAGKVVLDATNPLVFRPDAPPTLALGQTDSGGEQVQRWLPKSRVVKVFNTVGHAHMVNPKFPGGPPDMFICGNDSGAKELVTAICKDFGWPAIDAGGMESARLLEPLCILWVNYGVRSGGWDHAFKLLRK